MLPCLRRRNPAIAHQVFDVTVIPRSTQNLAVTQMINTRIAHMRPIRSASLHETDRARGPRPLGDRQRTTNVDHRCVRTADGQMQESEGIDQRLSLLKERVRKGIDGGGSRKRSAYVPPHPINDDEAGDAIGDQDARTVLIFLAVTVQTEIRMFASQSVFPNPAGSPGCYSAATQSIAR